MKTTVAVFFLSVLGSSLAVRAQTPREKWLVLPFASLTGGVPAKAGGKAASMLSTELRNTEKVEVLEWKKAPPADAFSEPLSAARKKVAEASQLRSARRFRQAEEALLEAIEGMKASAGGLTDVSEFSDAFVLLSAVQYNTGRDEEGFQSLSTALAQAPAREPPLAKTSALFRQVVEQTRQKVLSGPKGSVRVESTPAGAPVMIDTVLLGSTPLWVKEVPVGLHTWRVALATGELGGGTVEVSPNKEARVAFDTRSTDPEVALTTQLSMNALNTEALDALKRLSARTQAQTLLFGALSQERMGLRLDGFSYDASAHEVRRLPSSVFDAELLSAGMEFYALGGKLLEKGTRFGEPVAIPATVTGRPSGPLRATEVKYRLTGGAEAAVESVEPTSDESGPKPSFGPGRRVPLKKN